MTVEAIRPLSLAPLRLVVYNNAIWLAATNFQQRRESMLRCSRGCYFMHVGPFSSISLGVYIYSPFFLLGVYMCVYQSTTDRSANTETDRGAKQKKVRSVKFRLSHPGGRWSRHPCVHVHVHLFLQSWLAFYPFSFFLIPWVDISHHLSASNLPPSCKDAKHWEMLVPWQQWTRLGYWTRQHSSSVDLVYLFWPSVHGRRDHAAVLRQAESPDVLYPAVSAIVVSCLYWFSILSFFFFVFLFFFFFY